MSDELETQIEDVESAEPAQSMEDTIRASLADMKARNSEGVEELTTPQQKADRSRDKVGKFAKEKADRQHKEGAEEQAAASEAPEQDEQAPAVAAPVVQQSQYQAPASFTAEGKAAFSKASPEMQKEVLKREADFHKHYQSTQPAVKYAETLHKVIQPYEQTFQRLGATPDQAIQGLLATDHRLRYGSPQEKIQSLAVLVKEYGIDLSQGLPEQTAVDPNVEYLQRQNREAMQAAQRAQQQVEELRQTYTQREEQERNARVQQEIDQAVKSGMPHLRELGVEIGTIIQSATARNQEITLQQAYEMALWASPQHRQELLAQQQADKQAEDAKKREAEAALARSARQSASINVQRRGTLPAQKKVGSMEDTIREALAAQRNR